MRADMFNLRNLTIIYFSLSVMFCGVPAISEEFTSYSQCVSLEKRLAYRCTVKINRDAAVFNNAKIQVGAIMPSMPMAHNVRPVMATAAENNKGEYNFELVLEMFGIWELQFDILDPVRDRLTNRLDFRRDLRVVESIK